MRCSQSTDLLMFLSLETLMAIRKTSWHILVELIDLVNSNFSISNSLYQMVNFPTCIPDCGSHSLVLLDSVLSSDTSVCSTMVFPALGNSDHVVVSVSIDFPSYPQWGAPFHHIACDYCCADWDSFLERCSMGEHGPVIFFSSTTRKRLLEMPWKC